MLDTILVAIGPVLEGLAGKYGIVAQVVLYVGMFRLIMKPIVTAVQEIVVATPSKNDDAFVAKILANPIYKSVCFALDWMTSIKLPKA